MSTPHGTNGHRCHDADPRCLEAAREFGRWWRITTLTTAHREDGDCTCPLCREVA